MKLRTLKDIEYDRLGKPMVAESVKLRQEAIKWIKEKKGCILCKDWMEFFNITEEDLK